MNKGGGREKGSIKCSVVKRGRRNPHGSFGISCIFTISHDIGGGSDFFLSTFQGHSLSRHPICPSIFRCVAAGEEQKFPLHTRSFSREKNPASHYSAAKKELFRLSNNGQTFPLLLLLLRLRRRRQPTSAQLLQKPDTTRDERTDKRATA